MDDKICETVFIEHKVASRGWHVYGRSVWQRPSYDDKIFAEKDTDERATAHDKFAVAWKKEDRGKVVPDTVGHVPREISRAVWFFLDLRGTVSERVFDSKYYPSPIPRGGLEFILRVKFVIAEEKWRILDRMRDILINNYTTSFSLGEEMGEMPPEIEEVSTDTDDDLPSLIVDDEHDTAVIEITDSD